MGFDDQSVEPEVHGLLRQRGDQLALASDVARVAEDGEVGVPAAKFDRNMPERSVAVDFFLVGAESPVDDAQPSESGVVEPFDRADPQFQVGIDGVSMRRLAQQLDVVPMARLDVPAPIAERAATASAALITALPTVVASVIESAVIEPPEPI